jgi:hypothetical protein
LSISLCSSCCCCHHCSCSCSGIVKLYMESMLYLTCFVRCQKNFLIKNL